jgi:hypothetical protein
MCRTYKSLFGGKSANPVRSLPERRSPFDLQILTQSATEIYQWKVDNNIFGSRQEAAWAKKKEAEKAAKAAEAPKPAESVAPAEPALLIKRGRGPRRAPAYNMDGEVVPEPLYLDENRHIVYPEDWPYYYDDKNPEHCEPHKNYVPRIGIHKWRNQCLERTYAPTSTSEKGPQSCGNLANVPCRGQDLEVQPQRLR